jgi:integrase/recombinase XerD
MPSGPPAPIPTASALAIAAGDVGGGLPCYVTGEQARAIIIAATRLGGMRDRLLVECLWQAGGRVSEVLRLRPADVVQAEGALRLINRKQRRPNARKLVYISDELVAELMGYARDARINATQPLFRSRQSANAISATQAWRIVGAASRFAAVRIVDGGAERPANPRDFRHGSAVHQIRQGVPLSEVAQQLGHARLDSTAIYTRLANPERRMMADRVTW